MLLCISCFKRLWCFSIDCLYVRSLTLSLFTFHRSMIEMVKYHRHFVYLAALWYAWNTWITIHDRGCIVLTKELKTKKYLMPLLQKLLRIFLFILQRRKRKKNQNHTLNFLLHFNEVIVNSNWMISIVIVMVFFYFFHSHFVCYLFGNQWMSFDRVDDLSSNQFHMKKMGFRSPNRDNLFYKHLIHDLTSANVHIQTCHTFIVMWFHSTTVTTNGDGLKPNKKKSNTSFKWTLSRSEKWAILLFERPMTWSDLVFVNGFYAVLSQYNIFIQTMYTRHAAHLFIIPMGLYEEKVGKLWLLLLFFFFNFVVWIHIYSTMNNKWSSKKVLNFSLYPTVNGLTQTQT